MSELLERQQKFALLVPRLIDKAHELGYHVTLGHAWRCEDCQVGHAKSLHRVKLAIDINLFDSDTGDYLSDEWSHQALGEWWEAQGGTWGGRFGDANHYSLGPWEGVR